MSPGKWIFACIFDLLIDWYFYSNYENDTFDYQDLQNINAKNTDLSVSDIKHSKEKY